MPYITCNGHTRSRGDSSPEVKKCIAEEKAHYTKVYQACMADAECKANHEFKTKVVIGGGIAIFLMLFILMIIVFRAMDRPVDEG